MPYRIAGIDVHKKMLAVVVADVEVEGEYEFERCRFSTSPEHLRLLAEWLIGKQVEEVVMESTAQYWKPVWGALERYWTPTCKEREGTGPMSGALHLAQALSNRGRRGRKMDFPDAERLVKRLVAEELVLSFVPDPEQRLWPVVTRRKLQMTRLHVRMQNQLESLLEEAHIKLSGVVTDLLGVSARRMLQALAEEKPIRPLWLPWRISACEPPRPSCATRWGLAPSSTRRLIKMALQELQFLEQQMGQLDQEIANLLRPHEDAVKRLAGVPGLGVDSAQVIIAEVGPTAASFASDKQLCSWVGVCLSDNESAGVNHSHRSPKGNRRMRRILNQAGNAAARTKGSIFEIVYRRQVPRMGHNQAIGVIAHRLCQLIWILLHRKVRYEERGPAVTETSKRKRTVRMIRELRALGYPVETLNLQTAASM
jgi:transposase